ncbi:MAG TPA: c-type cytochrome [Pseudolabrys sp.]|jgi:cytochrome c|nr:c-type cytochrome [Pseudolabrys sp.]
MNVSRIVALAMLASLTTVSHGLAAEGNATRGQRVFGACAACHSLQPNVNMTGPSLAGLWGRKAGSLASFDRYSPALQSADVVWNDKTLDAWLKDPQQLVPGNHMTFPGIRQAQPRTDLLAYLKEATAPGASHAENRSMQGGMGMMRGGEAPNLKSLDSAQRVTAVTYCKDTYTVATADGKTRKFWERNLRLKTDSGASGPQKNAPALLGAGMMGDRADIIFASPDEISPFVAAKCPSLPR